MMSPLLTAIVNKTIQRKRSSQVSVVSMYIEIHKDNDSLVLSTAKESMIGKYDGLVHFWLLNLLLVIF